MATAGLAFSDLDAIAAPPYRRSRLVGAPCWWLTHPRPHPGPASTTCPFLAIQPPRRAPLFVLLGEPLPEGTHPRPVGQRRPHELIRVRWVGPTTRLGPQP